MKDEIIDFTEIVKKHPSYRAYGGGNGIKKGIVYNGESYMLKIEHRDRKKDRYINSVLSEYISCKIFSILDMPVQEVILGKIIDNQKEKFCVACKDFKEKGEYLYEFISIKNSVISDNESNGSGTELSEILKAIEEQKFYNSNDVRQMFWDMFIIDSFLGNFDRHNGNWGFLVNENTGEKRLAPVYDCGSCLYPSATDNDLKDFLKSKEEIEKRVYEFPNSAIKLNDKKINYYNFLLTTDNRECISSLKKQTKKINEKFLEIKSFINQLSVLSDTRKNFYIKILEKRKELILEYSLEKQIEKEKIK